MKTPRRINAERKRDGLPPLNFALFRKVIKKLETAPEAYDQSTYATKSDDAPCGTAACIAGWATVLDGRIPHTRIRQLNRRADKYGQRALGLTNKESEVLFSGLPVCDWPRQFSSQWREVRSEGRQARVAIRYLKHIITTGKVTK